MADNRQRAERLAAALGIGVEVARRRKGSHYHAAFTWPIAQPDKRREMRDAWSAHEGNVWSVAADRLASLALAHCGELAMWGADLARAESAAKGARAAVLRIEDELMRARAHRDAAEQREAVARERWDAALAAATPEQRAAWNALREVGR